MRKRKKMSGSKKKKAAPKHSKTKVANRRMHRRKTTRNLWVTEFNGDFQFIVSARDISEGGIFLNRRIKTSNQKSTIRIPAGSSGVLELTARPVHDQIAAGAFGVGYQFVDMSTAQTKTLRALLRNLD